MKSSKLSLIAVCIAATTIAMASTEAESLKPIARATKQEVARSVPETIQQPHCAAPLRTLQSPGSDHISARGLNNHPGGGILPTQKLWRLSRVAKPCGPLSAERTNDANEITLTPLY